MKIKLYPFLLSLMLLLLSAGNVSAATPVLKIYQTGNGIYTISGNGMDSIQGMSFIVEYDASALSNPRIQRGQLVSNSLYADNAKYSNASLMIAAGNSSQAFASTGVIATITFDRIPGSTPKPLSITNTDFRSFVDNSQNNPEIIYGQGNLTDNPIENKDPGATPPPTNPPETTGFLGTVTMPTDTPAAEQKTPSGQAESTGTIYGEQQGSESVAGHLESQQADSGKEEKKEESKEKFVSHLSMIERFRLYEGERTPEKLLALLKETGKGYSQDPPVLLTDGKATAKVSISLPPDTTTAPNVAISREGQMVSFKRGEEGIWVVEIRPKKDVGQVTLTYFVNNQVTEIPLTVAPKLENFKGKPFAKLTEADFVQFLAGRTAAKELQTYDLNKDQVLNHIDDFIFSANYLVQVPPVKTDKAQPAAKPSQEPPPVKPQEKAKPAAGSGKP